MYELVEIETADDEEEPDLEEEDELLLLLLLLELLPLLLDPLLELLLLIVGAVPSLRVTTYLLSVAVKYKELCPPHADALMPGQ